jgi:hypothetical protein
MAQVKCPKCKRKREWDHRFPECEHCETNFDAGMECALCGGFVACEKYGDGNCETCGQRYEYDECRQMVLTEDQLALLRSKLVNAGLPSDANDQIDRGPKMVTELALLEWRYTYEGSWESFSRIGDEGGLFAWRIAVREDGVFYVDGSSYELTDRNEPFDTLREAKSWCNERESAMSKGLADLND